METGIGLPTSKPSPANDRPARKTRPSKQQATGQRPIWRGNLRLALVSCPLALYNANQDHGTIHFHLINPQTGNRTQMITQDAETAKMVSRRDPVKAYEYKRDSHVLLRDEDFESVKISSSSTMNIEKFVDAGSIDPLHYDTSYFVGPDGAARQDVYAAL